MKPLILMVDDEIKNSDSTVEELVLSGYEIVLHREVDSALQFFEAHSAQIDLLILDIMMPPGTELNGEDTRHGMRTGIPLFTRIRSAAPTLPVIVLTNVSDPRVAIYFEREAHVRFLRKENCLPYQLAEEVAHMLRKVASA